MKKYLLMPGHVKSTTDNDNHYISAVQLADLYKVPLSECHVYNRAQPESKKGIDTRNYIRLFPRQNGDYRPPEGS